MLITVDAGNTNVGLVAFRGRRAVAEARLATRRGVSAAAWLHALRAATRAWTGPWTGVAFASVVPTLDRPLKAALRKRFGAEVWQADARTPLAVANAYARPDAVGADRLLAAVAAAAEFGAPVIVADFGTAITVDAVDRRGRYLGGAILPGPALAADALARGTALLPRIVFDRRRPLVLPGRTTAESIEAGLLLGSAGAVELLVARLRRRLGARTPVVVTGGLARWVAPHAPALKILRPRLVHDGLRLAWASRPRA